mgnify:CR=1 FL=1
MASEPAAIRSFIQGREAAAEAERRRSRGAPARSDWSIALALSMIAAAERAGVAAVPRDAVSQRQEAEVRAVWQLLWERW